MEYKKPFIPLEVTATCSKLNHTPIHSTSHPVCIAMYHHLCSRNMSTKGSPPKRANRAPPRGTCGSQQCHDNLSGSLNNVLRTTTGKDSGSGKHTNQYRQLHGYGYPASQQPFPGAPQFYHHPPFYMTHNSSQPTTSISQQHPSYGPQLQGYDLHQGGYGESQMSPQQQLRRQGPLSPDAPRVPQGPPGYNPINQPRSSSSTSPPGPPSRVPARLRISLPEKWFQPPAELWKIMVPGIRELPPLPKISYDDYDADDESDHPSDLSGAEGKPPASLKQAEFSLKQFAKRIATANYWAYNKWKKVWVAAFLEKKHQSTIRGPKRLKQLNDGHLHWKTAVADSLEIFEDWLPLDNFDNAKWIRQPWV